MAPPCVRTDRANSFLHSVLLSYQNPPQSAQCDPSLLPQFFSDVREAEEQLRKLQETLRRKYTCDRSITVTRLEDLLQDAQVSQARALQPGERPRSRALTACRGEGEWLPDSGMERHSQGQA